MRAKNDEDSEEQDFSQYLNQGDSKTRTPGGKAGAVTMNECTQQVVG